MSVNNESKPSATPLLPHTMLLLAATFRSTLNRGGGGLEFYTKNRGKKRHEINHVQKWNATINQRTQPRSGVASIVVDSNMSGTGLNTLVYQEIMWGVLTLNNLRGRSNEAHSQSELSTHKAWSMRTIAREKSGRVESVRVGEFNEMRSAE